MSTFCMHAPLSCSGTDYELISSVYKEPQQINNKCKHSVKGAIIIIIVIVTVTIIVVESALTWKATQILHGKTLQG